MSLKDIKLGETYYVRVKVITKSENCFVCRPLICGDTMSDFAPNFFNFAETEAFYQSIPEQTKHDPCRLLKEGDKVQVIARNGRCWGKTGEYLRGAYCFVLEDEERNDMVKVRHNSSEYTIDPAYLELVTPAEEMEPYSVETCQYGYTVNKGELILATYNDENHSHAKEAAEAERDRLNAEWRKEQK